MKFAIGLSVLLLMAVPCLQFDLPKKTHRGLHPCIMEMSTQTRVQKFVEGACTATLYGVDDCVIDIPDSILRDFQQECEADGGVYLSIADYEVNLAANVCNEYVGLICGLDDNSETCSFNPYCTWNGYRCNAGARSCIPVRFEFLYPEHPYCISPSCDCLSTATEIMDEDEADLRLQVATSYAKLGNPDWTSTSDFDRGATCGSPSVPDSFPGAAVAKRTTLMQQASFTTVLWVIVFFW